MVAEISHPDLERLPPGKGKKLSVVGGDAAAPLLVVAADCARFPFPPDEEGAVDTSVPLAGRVSRAPAPKTVHRIWTCF
jgi:hypothetical protein